MEDSHSLAPSSGKQSKHSLIAEAQLVSYPLCLRPNALQFCLQATETHLFPLRDAARSALGGGVRVPLTRLCCEVSWTWATSRSKNCVYGETMRADLVEAGYASRSEQERSRIPRFRRRRPTLIYQPSRHLTTHLDVPDPSSGGLRSLGGRDG